MRVGEVRYCCSLAWQGPQPVASDLHVPGNYGGIVAIGGTLARGLGHFVAELADVLDPELHDIAGLEEFAAAGADACRRAGEDQVAGMERQPRRQMGNLLGEVEDHLASVGILLDD